MGAPWPLCSSDEETLFPLDAYRPSRRICPLPRPLALDTVLLELSGVLYDASLWRRWLFQLVSRVGLHTHYATFFRCWEAEYQDEVLAGKRDYWDAMRQYLRTAGLTRGQTEEIATAGRSRQEQFEREMRPLPGVNQTLLQLGLRGVRLALYINAPLQAAELQERLSRLQLLNRFQMVLNPRELPFLTPRERLQYAVEKLGVSSSSLAFVGHDSRNLAAAAAVGMHPLAFNFDLDAVAEVYLDQFDQLLSVVEQRPLRIAA